MSVDDRKRIATLLEGRDSLDFDTLRKEIIALAKKQVDKSPYAKEIYASRNAATYIDEETKKLNIALREILRIIPEEKWDYSLGDKINGWVDEVRELFGSQGIHHDRQLKRDDFSCTQDGHALGDIDPNKSLASQHVTCKKIDTMVATRPSR